MQDNASGIVAANDNDEFRFYVYAWRYPDGRTFYVGKGCGYRDAAPKTHNPFFKRIVAKIRSDGGEPSVVRWREGLREEDAHRLEVAYIKLFGRRDLGAGVLCNLTDGGEGLSNPSIESRARMAAARIGKIEHADAKAKRALKIKITWQSNELRDAQRRQTRQIWMRDGYKEFHANRFVETGAIEKIRESARVRAATSEWQELMRGKNATPEARSKNKEAQLAAPPKSAARYKGITGYGEYWRATATIDGIRVVLGVFETKEDAARAYDIAVHEVSKDAWLNFPDRIDSDWMPSPLSSEERRARRGTNLSAPPRNKFGLKGVDRSGKKWKSEVYRNGKLNYIGTYDTPEEAARAYDSVAITISDMAWLNFPAE